MSRPVTIATVQPPAADDDATPDSIQERALELLEAAADAGADIVCLPEYLNCMACGPEAVDDRAVTAAQTMLDAAATCARKHACYIVAPAVIGMPPHRFNRAHVIDRSGVIAGRFDKVHLTHVERDEWRVSPGDTWPVFACDFGRIGIMICYDGCFLEPARLLALNKAEIIFWPSLQRSFTERELLLQTQTHAYFNHVIVVRSSYGTDKNRPWRPGRMVGMSCVCGQDGALLANLGRWTGWTMATVDLDQAQVGARSFGGDLGKVKEMRFGDRRPETYGGIVEPARE